MRDRDVRNAIAQALVDTTAFNGVHLWGLPEDYGSGSSEQAAVWILPVSCRQEDLWDAAPDGELLITGVVSLVIAYRASSDDPQIRDEGCELLLEQCKNALNGNGLGELIFTQTARVTGWAWQPPASAERRIVATYSYQFLEGSWNDADTTA